MICCFSLRWQLVLPDTMAKKKSKVTEANAEAEGNKPPTLVWRQEKEGDWVASITIGNIVMPLEPRPFMGFLKGERDAILVWVKQALSEVLFDVPRYIVNKETGRSAENPDWKLLPYWEQGASGEFVEIEPKPSAMQVEAGNNLPVET